MKNEVTEPVFEDDDDDKGVFPSVFSASSSSRLLSSSFISLSYSTHSGTIRAAAVSLGSLVLGLLHCSRQETERGGGGGKEGALLGGKGSRQNTSVPVALVPLSPSDSHLLLPAASAVGGHLRPNLIFQFC